MAFNGEKLVVNEYEFENMLVCQRDTWTINIQCCVHLQVKENH